METKRKALGKGLEQLFSNEVINFENFEKNIVETTPKSDITKINLSEIRSNPYQPRKTFDEDTLQELAKSIKEYGIIEPIIVKKAVKGYELVAGERRCKAAKLAGLETVPAVIKDFNDQEMMEIALLENIQREDLNAIDEAEAYDKIIELGKMTQEEFATKFGKSRSYVTNMLGLLVLPESVKVMVRNKELTMGHARALSKLEDKIKMDELARKVVKDGLSVRALEQLISEEELPKRMKQDRFLKETKSIQNTIYERLMREKVGTKVKIKTKKIEIPYDSEKDLERILEILGIRIEGGL
ncbi:MAG: ParB/RepB/Spo0J family partition protein [Bacilli bacterium]|nr:ParB/RepB/Spo0J family partition protein [Bacilli bacterium]MBR1818073.1 ParB/RepB/Spo0J family partition protein [Bacilli bacterium]